MGHKISFQVQNITLLNSQREYPLNSTHNSKTDMIDDLAASIRVDQPEKWIGWWRKCSILGLAETFGWLNIGSQLNFHRSYASEPSRPTHGIGSIGSPKRAEDVTGLSASVESSLSIIQQWISITAVMLIGNSELN